MTHTHRYTCVWISNYVAYMLVDRYPALWSRSPFWPFEVAVLLDALGYLLPSGSDWISIGSRRGIKKHDVTSNELGTAQSSGLRDLVWQPSHGLPTLVHTWIHRWESLRAPGHFGIRPILHTSLKLYRWEDEQKRHRVNFQEKHGSNMSKSIFFGDYCTTCFSAVFPHWSHGETMMNPSMFSPSRKSESLSLDWVPSMADQGIAWDIIMVKRGKSRPSHGGLVREYHQSFFKMEDFPAHHVWQRRRVPIETI